MDLDRAFVALEDRARIEPALEVYRVAGGGPGALEVIPEGWHVSAAIARIATDGGWWPGEWQWALGLETQPMFESGRVAVDDAEVRWLAPGTIWERDWFFTPLLRTPIAEAPLLGTSSQALSQAIELPSDAALLEAFIITYDELGLDEYGMVDPMFVDWITVPPGPGEPPGAHRVHHRLRELVADRSSAHPTWSSPPLPMRVEGLWPDELVPLITGVDRSRLQPW